jgi:hypothetical protein
MQVHVMDYFKSKYSCLFSLRILTSHTVCEIRVVINFDSYLDGNGFYFWNGEYVFVIPMGKFKVGNHTYN